MKFLFLIQYRLKLITRNKNIWILIITIMTIFALTLGALSVSMEERSSIPIGIIDFDNTESSKILINNINTKNIFYVYEGGQEYINEMLKNGQVKVVFTIKSGYEDRIIKGSTDGLIQVSYLRDSKSHMILSDIISGEFLYPICINKSYNKLVDLYENKGIDGINGKGGIISRSEYTEYADSIRFSDLFDFTFDIEYIDIESNKLKEATNNSIIYKYVIGCILSGFISFIILFMANGIIKDKEYGIDKRLKTTKLGKNHTTVADVMVVLIVGAVLNILLEFIIYINMDVGLGMLIDIFILFEVFIGFYGLLFIVIARLVKSIGNLQIIGTTLIFCFSFLSILGVISDFIYGNKLLFMNAMPNYRFIEGFVNLIE